MKKIHIGSNVRKMIKAWEKKEPKIRLDIEKCKRKKGPYSYRVIWSEEDKEYVGLCAEFPSLSWLAPTRIGALRGIKNIVTGILNDEEAQ